MNYMEKVAEMLGVELNERFNVIPKDKKNSVNYTCWVDNEGLYRIAAQDKGNHNNYIAVKDEEILEKLLTGAYELVKIPWKPKTGNRYCFIGTSGVIHNTTWINCAADIALYAMGNCYRTKAEAEKHKDEVLAKMKEVMKG